MKKQNDLHKLLNSPAVPVDLQSQIRANYQTTQPHQRPPYRAIAALLLLGLLTFINLDTTPDVVHAAFNDIGEAEKHPAMLAINPSFLQQQYQLDPGINTLPLKLTKYCSLAGHPMAHVRLEDKTLGEIHLFLYQGEFDQRLWNSSHGQFNTQHWQTLRVREDLSVLLIYPQRDDLEPVQALTHHIFTLS